MTKKKRIKEEPKKKVEKKSMKKKVTKYRCYVKEQWKDFDTQTEARNMAKRILDTDYIFFVDLYRVKVEEKDKET